MRSLLGVLLSVGLGLPQVAFAQAEASKVAVGYIAAHDFDPVFVAKEKGFFAKHGLDVTLTRIAIPPTIPPALISGSLNIGAASPLTLFLTNENGLDLVALIGSERQSKAAPDMSIIAGKDSGITAVAGLKGKKLGVPGIGSGMDLVMRHWMLSHDLKPDGMTIVEAQATQMRDMLKSQLVDAVAVSEPTRSAILDQGVGIKLADYFAEVQDNMLMSVWIATRGWAESHRGDVEKFDAATADAVDDIRKNPGDVKDIEIKYIGFSSPALPIVKTAIEPADFAIYSTIGHELGKLQKETDPASLIFK